VASDSETEDTFEVDLGVAGNSTIHADFTSYSLTSDFTTPTDAWHVTVVDTESPADLRRLWRPLVPVRVYVGGFQQLIGRVDITRGNGANSALTVRGRDYLADLIAAGSLDPTVTFKKGEKLADAIVKVTKPWGITRIVERGFNDQRFHLTGGTSTFADAPEHTHEGETVENYRADYNEAAWNVIDRITARAGLMAQPASQREELALVAPEYRQSPMYELRRPGNVKIGAAERDWSSVPTFTLSQGRGATDSGHTPGMYAGVSTFGDDSVSDIGRNTEVRRIAYGSGADFLVVDSRFDPKVSKAGQGELLYRPLFYRDRDALNQKQLDRGLRRMVSERMRDTLVYTCSVQGHRDPESGALWAVDTIASVRDEIEDVDEVLWIKERTFNYERRGGPTTDLTLIRPSSFVL